MLPFSSYSSLVDAGTGDIKCQELKWNYIRTLRPLMDNIYCIVSPVSPFPPPTSFVVLRDFDIHVTDQNLLSHPVAFSPGCDFFLATEYTAGFH